MPDSLLIRYNVSALHKNQQVNEPKPSVYRPNPYGTAIAAAERKFHKRFPLAEFCPDLRSNGAQELKCDLDLQLNHIHRWHPVWRERLEKIYKKVNYDLNSGQPGYWKRQR